VRQVPGKERGKIRPAFKEVRRVRNADNREAVLRKLLQEHNKQEQGQARLQEEAGPWDAALWREVRFQKSKAERCNKNKVRQTGNNAVRKAAVSTMRHLRRAKPWQDCPSTKD
jgi:hypothetical protein